MGETDSPIHTYRIIQTSFLPAPKKKYDNFSIYLFYFFECQFSLVVIWNFNIEINLSEPQVYIVVLSEFNSLEQHRRPGPETDQEDENRRKAEIIELQSKEIVP